MVLNIDNLIKPILIPLGMAIFSLMPTSAFALVWSPQLVQIESSAFHAPQDVIQIELPESVTEKIYKTLAFELDNIDITAMVVQSGSATSYKPVQPLKWGRHVLRLVEYQDDGSIEERGYWEFEVRDSAVFQAIDYSIDSNLTVSQRIAEKNSGTPEPNSLSGQGAAILQGLLSNEDWQINGNVDLIYNSETERTQNGEEIDIGEYLVTGRNDTTQLSLGYHSVAQQSLVIDNFYRRGLSADMRLNSINSIATGFVMRAEEVTGTQVSLGISDSDNTVTGLSWETQPLTNNPEKLFLSATYLSGKSNKTAESTGAIQTAKDIDTWGFVADFALINQQLRLRAEYAESTSDIITDDVSDADIIDGKGTAKSFLVTYSPQMTAVDNHFFWNTGIEYSEISTLFFSLANPNLPSDKKLNRIFLNANWANVSAQLLTAKETDNVDADSARPQIETLLYQVALNYNPITNPVQGSIFNILGRPSFSLNFSKMVQDQIKESLVPTTDLNIEISTSTFTVTFVKERFNWTWSSTLIEQDDKIDTINNATTWSHALRADFQASNRFEIKPTIQSQQTDFTVVNSTSDNLLLGLDLAYLFTDSLTGRLNLNHSSTNGDSNGTAVLDGDVVTAGYDVVWSWIKPKNNKPGFDVVFKGIYQDKTDKVLATNDLETYEISIGIIMILPSSSYDRD